MHKIIVISHLFSWVGTFDFHAHGLPVIEQDSDTQIL